ncbi:hypothetical protein FRX31_011349, partial [Thalictrum thalictroides]
VSLIDPSPSSKVTKSQISGCSDVSTRKLMSHVPLGAWSSWTTALFSAIEIRAYFKSSRETPPPSWSL